MTPLSHFNARGAHKGREESEENTIFMTKNRQFVRIGPNIDASWPVKRERLLHGRRASSLSLHRPAVASIFVTNSRRIGNFDVKIRMSLDFLCLRERISFYRPAVFELGHAQSYCEQWIVGVRSAERAIETYAHS